MLEALWTVSFASNVMVGPTTGFGTGVVVFQDGRIFGGDSAMVYTGNYEIVSGQIQANVHVETHAVYPGIGSTVGLPTFDLKVTGTPARDRIILSGYVVQDPNRKITITAVRRAEVR